MGGCTAPTMPSANAGLRVTIVAPLPMPRIEIPMPQMGESIAEGTLSVWLKRVGDTVERDEPIMEISTDKVDVEIPAPATGILVEITVAERETVGVGTIVGYIETEPGSPPPAGGEEGAGTLPGKGEASATESSIGRAIGSDSSIPSSRPGPSEALAQKAPASAIGESEEARLRVHSSPLVRRMVTENGLRLTDIRGTGRAGRVTKADVLRHLEGGPGTAGPVGGGEARDESFGWEAYYHQVIHPEAPLWDGDRVEPMSRMTSLIAEHMVLSRRISAHVHSFFEVDYTRIDGIREKNRALWEEQGVRVTYTSFVAVAAAQALREFPRLNAAISGSDVIFRGAVNIGMAVALDRGLIVPVIRNADQLSLVEMARAIQDLAARAREKRLSPEEVQGGTFTITNPGVFGTLIGFPILNQPQVGILGVGAVEKRPAVVSDEFDNDAIVIRRRGYLSLGFDHRLVNGADADRFTGRIKQILEAMQE